MKSFTVVLVGVLFALGLGWWLVEVDVCPVPISYRVGELDERFGLTSEEARSYVDKATTVWEDTTRRDLFVYDDAADFTVDFIFDGRQARADAEEVTRGQLDNAQTENEALRTQIEQLQAEYESLAASFEADRAAYEADLADYNQQVRNYNDRGGAPSDTHAELQAERAELDERAQSLSQTAAELNALAENINRLGTEGNRRIEQYNERVEDYNEQFGYVGEFTQGDYRGDAIHIYKFSTTDELLRVLVHEFGHALGIGHIEDDSSVMYYLLEEPIMAPTLTSEDLAAFTAVCGTGTELKYRVRQWLLPLTALNPF